MRASFFSFGLVVVALFFANSDRASASSFESVLAVETSEISVAMTSVDTDEPAAHCAHVPCANAAHPHSSCTAHSSFVMGGGLIGPDFLAAEPVALTHDRNVGRTLVPPVPPPLA